MKNIERESYLFFTPNKIKAQYDWAADDIAKLRMHCDFFVRWTGCCIPTNSKLSKSFRCSDLHVKQKTNKYIKTT